MPRGVYDRSKAKPRTKTTPTGRYRKRKIMTDISVAPEKPQQPYSQFLEELSQQLTDRDTEITERLKQIETESDALEVEESALKQEQEKVQAGLNALEAK